ncbi:methyltransferase [Tenacibaculum sp. UWU-22]|uniref:methyltransferase n=1 Tax=Tenacibaculum sp. UWU-22 TaxID=3234187 RepID=UPI0034DB5365
MESELIIHSKQYQLKRYPITTQTSLRAWSSAELLALTYITNKKYNTVCLYNDRFGVWNCTLHDKNPTTIWTYASQQKAISKNLLRNGLNANVIFKTPLDELNTIDIALIKIPKSVALFELFLQQIYKAATSDTEVVCCFMTKYFSAATLKVASYYFEEVQQTKAWKKARLIILKKAKKEALPKLAENTDTIIWKEKQFKQYYGVFSSSGIDVGTQFLLANLQVKPTEKNIIDLASGNGVIAYQITQQNSKATVTLIDDFNLAIASSKINLKGLQTHFICDNNLNTLPSHSFDLVVSNPPFHFEHENNIEVALSLFKQVKNCLKPNGRFLLVANCHLNYKTHLSVLFKTINVINKNNQFIIYECMC